MKSPLPATHIIRPGSGHSVEAGASLTKQHLPRQSGSPSFESEVAPDFETTPGFLDSLAGSSQFTFMALPEGVERGHRRRPHILHGSFDQLRMELLSLNVTGHGIFVMVNEGDLRGRKAENVIRVRALFVDLDGAPIEPVRASPLPPHVVVNTSPGRFHAYWRIQDCPLADFRERQQALARRFGGDRAVCDLPRVMRLPGSLHLKGDTPFLVTCTTQINSDQQP